MQQATIERHDLVGKLIYWEECKKLKFDHTNKWCTHNPESVLENETHKLLWDFEIQTDHLILARRPDLVIIQKTNNPPPKKKPNKNNPPHQKNEILTNCGLCCPG